LRKWAGHAPETWSGHLEEGKRKRKQKALIVIALRENMHRTLSHGPQTLVTELLNLKPGEVRDGAVRTVARHAIEKVIERALLASLRRI
jgi:hypothetical protein